MNIAGLKILEEIKNLYQGRKKTELQLAEKYGTTQDNIIYILTKLGYSNTLLKRESDTPIAAAWEDEKLRSICNEIVK